MKAGGPRPGLGAADGGEGGALDAMAHSRIIRFLKYRIADKRIPAPHCKMARWTHNTWCMWRSARRGDDARYAKGNLRRRSMSGRLSGRKSVRQRRVNQLAQGSSGE
jgi:hypothetical protein